MSSIRTAGSPNPPQVGEEPKKRASVKTKLPKSKSGAAIESLSNQNNHELLRKTEEELKICRAELEEMQKNFLESEKQRMLLFMDLPLAMYATDATGKITHFNIAASTIWGREPQIGKEEFNAAYMAYGAEGNLIPYSELPTAVAIREKRSIRNAELQIEQPDGTRKYILSNPQPIFDSDGNVAACVNTLIDITDRKKAELLTKESEATLRTILENTKDAYVLFDKEAKVVAFNRVARDMYFQLNETILEIGKSVYELILPDRQTFAKEIFDRCFQGETFELTINRTIHNEVEHWYKSSYYPIKSEDGSVIAISIKTSEITEEITTQSAIQKSEATLKLIIENTRDAHILLDKTAHIVGFNRVAQILFQKISGKELEEGKLIYDFIHPEHQVWLKNHYDKVIHGEIFENDLVRTTSEGKTYFLKEYINALASSDGEVLGLCITRRDITSEIEAQATIKKSEADLRALFDNAKDGFVLLSPDEEILAFNNAAADLYKKIFGRNLEVGKSAIEVLGPDIGPYVHSAFAKVLSGESFEQKSKQKAIDRNEYWLRGFYNPVKSPDGTIIGICMGIADITNEIEANAYASRLAAIVESSADAIIGKTLEGIITSWNRAAEKMFGYSAHEMIGQSITRLIPEDHLDEEPEILRRIRAGERIEHFETIRRTKSGELRNISLTISPIRNNDGELVGASKTARDITEQNLLLEQIRESELRFRTVADTAPVLIWMSGSDKLCDFFNKGWLEFRGRTLEEELGNGWTEGLHPEDRPLTLATYSDSFDAREEFSMESRLLRYDGQYRWVAVNGVPRFSPDGTFIGYIGSCIDVTSRKIAGEQLEKEVQDRTIELTKKNEELLQQKNFMETVLDSSIDQICVYDKEMRFLAGNKTFLKESHLKADDIVGKTFLEVFPNLHNSAIYNGLNLAISGKPSQGTWKSVETGHSFTIFFTPPDKNNDFYGAMITAHDNTEIIEFSQKLLELNAALEEKNTTLQEKNDEVQQQKEFIETIVDASVDLITVYDTEMRVLSVNKQVEKLLGLKRNDIIGKTYSELFSGGRASQTYQNLLRSIGGEETHHVLPAGESGRSFDVFMVPLKHHTKVYAVLVLTHDITDIMNISEQLRLTNKTLEEKNTALVRSNSELEQFAYIASHDLQEPLRKIRMFSGRIKEKPENLDETTVAYLGKIMKSSDRMSDLIKDILQYSRLSNLKTTFQRTNLATLIKSVLSDFDLIVEEKKALVTLETLPIIDAVPQQLSQLFANLLSNSLKFSREGIAPHITISSSLLSDEEIRYKKLDEMNRYYKITVKDNGIGFNMAFAEKIFVIFQRLNDRSEFEGTGIGLALCRKITTLHGGEIHAESKEGEGAEFQIILPEKHVKNSL